MPAPRTSSHSQQASLVASEKDLHSPQITLGLAANLGQFLLLVLVNAFVGAMVGLERSVTPLLGEQVFGLTSLTITLSFIGVFGLVKALANLGAGTVSDHIGRKKVLIAGWLAALPVPFLLIAAPTWEWVVFANVLLGVNQGLCWSIAVIMKVDLVGPARRGLAMGINEAAGYGALALSAMGAGYLATTYGLRPYPFLPGTVFALAGLLLSVFLVRESQGFARQEAQRFTNLDERAGAPSPVEASSPRRPHERERPPVDHALAQQKSRTFGEIFLLTSWRNRALFSVSQSGFVNNLNDGLAWGLFPLVFAAPGLSVAQVGVLAGIYPGVWSVAQLGTGWLSDRLGRKRPIVAGMWLQAAAILMVAFVHGFAPWALAMALLGLGTALVYPVLLAAVSDEADPRWRASAIGVYRLWRDAGYLGGALLAGALADLLGASWAIIGVGILTFISGLVTQARMYETLPARRVVGLTQPAP